jgi:hypothetical protein
MTTTRVNLHDTLNKKSFGSAILCTYTFDVDFFEGYCLEQLVSFQDTNEICILIDRREYDRLLAGPSSGWPTRANVRYLLHPVRATGRFHPKVFLFASKDRGLLIVGSANLTRAGLTQNAELVVSYQFEAAKHEEQVSLFQEVFDFLHRVETLNPSSELESSLHQMQIDAPWLTRDAKRGQGPQFLHNLAEPLWDQITAGIKGTVDAMYVLAPFFDAEPDLLDHVQGTLHPKCCVIYTANGQTTLTEAWLEHEWVRQGEAGIRFCSILDAERQQRLHAKALAIVQGDAVRLAVGSANFTRAALLSTPSEGNVEALVLLDNLRLSECNPERLFDPCRNARSEPLRSGRRAAELPPPTSSVRLQEATLEDTQLRCAVSLPDDLASGAVKAVLISDEYGTRRVPLSREGSDLFGTGLDRDFAAQCDKTVVVQVEVSLPGAAPVVSNRMLLVNLRDIVTGRSTRRERRIREAQQSAARFAAVLQELLKIEDPDALKLFLTHCDIRLVGSARPVGIAGPIRLPWEGASWELRRLGERNLRLYATVHDAVVGFCERHLRRLSKQSRTPKFSTVANFMHIALAIAQVLCAQVERLLVGFEEHVDPVDTKSWHNARGSLDIYLTLFQQLIAILDGEYFPTLFTRYEDQRVREALAPDLEPYREICLRLLQVHERVEALRARTLRVRDDRGNVGTPFVHESNLISTKAWPYWSVPIFTATEHAAGWLEATP